MLLTWGTLFFSFAQFPKNSAMSSPDMGQRRSISKTYDPCTQNKFIGDLYPLDSTIFLIFGYGSLLWKQEFEFTAEYNAYVRGFDRVFYQGSRDHRGTPEDPGRVVTLLPSEPEARVDGRAYQLPTDPTVVKKILNYLDARESGYDRHEIDLFDFDLSEKVGEDVPLDIFSHPAAADVPDMEGKRVVTLLYIATEQNPDYVGEASMDAMAKNILRCCGKSGPNKDYLFFLAECLEVIGAKDSHVSDLYATAKQIVNSNCRAE